MTLARLKKALGFKRHGEDKDFDEFLKYFDKADSVTLKAFKKRTVRFLVVGSEGRKIFFDSSSYKDTPKPLPVFLNGNQPTSVVDFVFGAHFLQTSKDILYSIKVHDLRRNMLNSGKRNFGSKRSNTSSSQTSNRLETIPNGVVACILINIDGFSNQHSNNPNKTISFPVNNRRNPTSDDSHSVNVPAMSSQRYTEMLPRRFYRMLFEHCAPLSVMVESLCTEAFIAASKSLNSHWSTGMSTDAYCVETIHTAYATFVGSLRDFCVPRMQFPVWPSLNNALTVISEAKFSQTEEDRNESVKSWLNMDSHHLYPNFHGDSRQPIFDSLVTLFVGNCLSPLICRDVKDHRLFLSKMITGILILHPGWIASLLPEHSANKANSRSSSMRNVMLNQFLIQSGCTETNLECSGGSIFNCTVICGQSRKYLLALLYMATYFLRFTCSVFTTEYVPDLGRGDVFEIEQQKRQTRMGSKTRRKSGSAASTSGDAHDSGISSQEDLTASIYSASTGSSPTHTSGLALCMMTRLTRDQCRIAEMAAQKAVSREAAAVSTVAASGATLQPSAVNTTNGAVPLGARSTLDTQGDATLPLGVTSSNTPSSTRYTEIPLLIEKSIGDPDDLCSCLPYESFPGQLTMHVDSDPQSIHSSVSANTLLNIRGMSDSSPSLTISTNAPSQSGSPTSSANLRFNASSAGAGLTKPADMNRAAPTSCTASPTASGSLAEMHPSPSLKHSNLPFIANHSLIGNSVLDHYCHGLSLQATSETPENFSHRLMEHLNQWLRLGPLIIRGMNLSTEKSSASNIASGSAYRRTKANHWCASGLIVNADTRTVEVMTVRQQNPRDSNSSMEAPPNLSRLQRAARHSFSQSTSRWGGKTDASGSGSANMSRQSCSMQDAPPLRQVKPAPLVVRLIDQLQSVFERTSCASLALRDLEGTLYSIYCKSRVLADLLVRTGPSLLSQRDRMALAACCSIHDLPLLLSTVSVYCQPAATLLNEHHTEWWIG